MSIRATFLSLCAVGASLCLGAEVARADANSEAVVKAVMIRKFVEFIKWPEDVSPQKQMQVKVCVYGETPMAQMNAVFDKKSASSPISYSLSMISSPADAGSCHVLFIGASRQDQLSSVLSAVQGKPVLTVSDMAGFAEKSGMIGFIVMDGKVRYNINNKAFGDAQIKVDAQLLEIANKVLE